MMIPPLSKSKINKKTPTAKSCKGRLKRPGEKNKNKSKRLKRKKWNARESFMSNSKSRHKSKKIKEKKRKTTDIL